MTRAWLTVALAVTTALIALGGLLHLFAAPPDAAPLPARLFGVLIAAAAADAAVLLRQRAPGIAWFAAVAAAALAAVEIVGALRAARLVSDAVATPAALTAGVVVLLAAAALGLLDALRPRARAISTWERLAAGAVAVAAVAATVAGALTLAELGRMPALVAATADDVTPFRLTGRLALITVMLGVGVGAVRDLHPGFARAWGRWSAGPGDLDTRRPSLVDLLGEELLPWRTARSAAQAGARAAAEAEARERERARLAADLHALVLPDLRRAAAAAESTAAPAPVIDGVRRALGDVERLMHERQSTVLEEYGLVAALEWLAERTEQQSPLRVDLELEGDLVDRRDGVRVDVARAAFRIALLALDNTVRHAGASTATIRLRADSATGVRLVLADDGPGASGTTRPSGTRGTSVGSPGRGIADMRREAEASGGTLHVTATPGVAIEATWPAG